MQFPLLLLITTIGVYKETKKFNTADIQCLRILKRGEKVRGTRHHLSSMHKVEPNEGRFLLSSQSPSSLSLYKLPATKQSVSVLSILVRKTSVRGMVKL